VFATQNPIDHEGTYPLPEAELDRFLFKIYVDYPSQDEEDEILRRASASVTSVNPRAGGVEEALTREQLLALRRLAHQVGIEDSVRAYARDLVRSTRVVPQILRGAGPRAGVHLLVAARWSALLAGRLFVTPDDIQRMLPEVLGHRLTLSTEAELDGLDAREVLRLVCANVEVPR
jgi:MoxR-like ATPase